MGMDNTKVLKVSDARFYINKTSTAATPVIALPADLDNPGASWEDFGNTSLEDILSFDQEGGDATTLGTLQNPSLITTYAAVTDSLAFTLQQWDKNAFEAYFGENVVEVLEGFYGIPGSPEQLQGAILIVIRSGGFRLPLLVPFATVYRGDAISIGGTDELSGLPITITPNAANGITWPWAIGEVKTKEQWATDIAAGA